VTTRFYYRMIINESAQFLEIDLLSKLCGSHPWIYGKLWWPTYQGRNSPNV